MIGAIALVHWKNGLFMNWFGNQKGEGFEYHLLVIAICIALIIRGAGASVARPRNRRRVGLAGAEQFARGGRITGGSSLR